MNRLAGVLVAGTTAVLAGCGAGSESGSDYEVVREMHGDTVVVHTISGSTWGAVARLVPELSIGELEGEPEYLFGQVVGLAVADDGTLYVLDQQAREVRVFSREGVFQSTIGRAGEGPGEINRPDRGSLALLSDGRLLVRDPRNARIQVYASDGEASDTWPIRGGMMTNRSLHQTADDEVHVGIMLDQEAGPENRRLGLLRFGPDGAVRDTLLPPEDGRDPPRVEWQSDDGGQRLVFNVPFTARDMWSLHIDGFFLHAHADGYWVELQRPGAPIRFGRSVEAVAVTPGERAEEQARVTGVMRPMDPDWEWNGPAIPGVKPPLRALFGARDGRIWAQTSEPAVEVDDPAYDPSDPNSVEDRWREPVAFDVFEPDGTYLGRVETERGFSITPPPVFDAEHVWATTRDALGVQRVVRFRIEVG